MDEKLYQIWIRCNDECPERRPGGLREVMAFEDKAEADEFADLLRDPFHEAEVREVEV